MPVYAITHRRRKSVFSFFSVNINLIIINVVAFILFAVLIGTNSNFIDYVAIKPSNIFQGQYIWTFITSMFMHGGFFHLFANMLSLFFVLVSAIFQGSDFNAFAVGASGAIFGLIGLLMLLTPNLPVYLMFIPIPIKMKYAAPGMLIVLWLISQAGGVPIGNTAHLGGFILGLAYGFYLRSKYKNKTKYIRKHFS